MSGRVQVRYTCRFVGISFEDDFGDVWGRGKLMGGVREIVLEGFRKGARKDITERA